MRKIIIPAAKLVPIELWQIGKLPAVIYPINDGIVFDHLLKQYETSCTSMDIICHESADKVHRRLSTYRSDKIHILDLPTLGDLAHTIYYGVRDTDEPVIINFSDTIVMDNIYEHTEDCFYYSMDYPSETWTFFEEENGVITTVYDKQAMKSDQQKKLFVGVFQILDTPAFARCLEEAFASDQKQMSAFYYALTLYSQSHPLRPIKTDNWFDIGHVDKYYNSKLEVESREFNHIYVDKNRGILRKSSDDKEKFIGEILWYLKLPADIEYVRPRIFSYSTHYENPYMEMEYYSYHTVHELFLYGDLTQNQWRDVFRRIKFICDDFKRYRVRDGRIRSALEDMYLTKTVSRLKKLTHDPRFESFFTQPITVNNVRYQSLQDICRTLETIIPQMLYDVDELSIIHGDLCFANIMVDSNFSFIKVIDPRGKFGPYDIYGDFRYELAKLFHSVDGKYDFIIKNLFTVEANAAEAVIDYQVADRQRDFDLYEIFLSVFSEEIGQDKARIELIEALLFLSMIPLHGENINHQYAMLATGLEILDRVANIRV